MNLKPNKLYTVFKRIKIHTKPLTEVDVSQTGIFTKETHSYLMFRGFRVSKSCVYKIQEANEE
jgi:hypothetical protein